MSTVLILAPVIVSSWPIITAAAAAAATSIGLRTAETASEIAQENMAASDENSVEIDIKQNESINDNVAEGQSLSFQAEDGVCITVKRDARGKCVVCAKGKGFTDAELAQRGQQFMDKFTQCYVYDKVMRELKAKNFQVVDQSLEKDESIRVHVRRWAD